MKRLKQLIKGITIATAVMRVCVEAYKDAKSKADSATEEVFDADMLDVVDECTGELHPFDVVMVGGEVCFLEGEGDVLILDGDGQVH